MKAFVVEKPGVARLIDVPEPAVGSDGVLLQIEWACVERI